MIQERICIGSTYNRNRSRDFENEEIPSGSCGQEEKLRSSTWNVKQSSETLQNLEKSAEIEVKIFQGLWWLLAVLSYNATCRSTQFRLDLVYDDRKCGRYRYFEQSINLVFFSDLCMKKYSISFEI